MEFSQENLKKINSMTKYPSIPTYHRINPKNGQLIEELQVDFTDLAGIVCTEKIDGTNGRIIVFPDGDWLIGSREELLYAWLDRVRNPALGIVDALHKTATELAKMPHAEPTVYFGEVYGAGINGKAAKNYTKTGKVAFRLFDVVLLDEFEDLLPQGRDQIAWWRDHGGQKFLNNSELRIRAFNHALPLVPEIRSMSDSYLPETVDEMYRLLTETVTDSFAQLDLDSVNGRAEGMVIRSHSRKAIAKVRYEDYERTLRATGKMK